MLQKTHSVAGMIAAEVVLIHGNTSYFTWDAVGALLLGCLAGTLADVDKPGSTMAKVLFPLSALLHVLKIKHRTLTHSLLFMALLVMLSLSLSPLYFWVFMLAYASHPLIDLLNDRGVQLLWPIPLKVRILPKWLAIDTGSTSETAFRWLLLIICLVLPFGNYVFPYLHSQ
ncbi:metal-dependent hydrolase [Paenibacillus roseipurpureus]|uniref:Metal-dependent hydrolase n=1 Tax=Paenibacillus roseopurpureus TaxID=2918901 RepID=A0AA96LS45_9BACL|nr:metal-dependent hydrolase [Paenibacillus sp. MBLB1832]WNR46283.1 metal-dependent hydrolase [Paenibacillus sp. MBLB1832]